VTGGVYKIKVQIHHSMLIYDYLWFQLHVIEFQNTIRTLEIFEDLLQFMLLLLFVISTVARL
jgi:hypothetical protein